MRREVPKKITLIPNTRFEPFSENISDCLVTYLMLTIFTSPEDNQAILTQTGRLRFD